MNLIKNYCKIFKNSLYYKYDEHNESYVSLKERRQSQMATSSIFRNVSIRDKHLAKGLLRALESAKKRNPKEHTISKPCTEVKGDDIKKVLKDFNK